MKTLSVLLLAIIVSFTFAKASNVDPIERGNTEPQVISLFKSIFNNADLVYCKASYFSGITPSGLPYKTYVKVMRVKVVKDSSIVSAYLESAPISSNDKHIRCQYVRVHYKNGTTKLYNVQGSTSKRNFDRIIKNAPMPFVASN